MGGGGAGKELEKEHEVAGAILCHRESGSTLPHWQVGQSESTDVNMQR